MILTDSGSSRPLLSRSGKGGGGWATDPRNYGNPSEG
jgi:hypothetical protein